MSEFITPKNIDMSDATAWARKWQKENGFHAKAFLIPVNDLIACLIEMDVLQLNKLTGDYSIENVSNSGIRAYMAIDRDPKTLPSADTEKLLIVGTKVDCNGIHRDLIEGEKPSGCPSCDVEAAVEALAGTGVFDFTDPCPNNCDPNSPLFNP